MSHLIDKEVWTGEQSIKIQFVEVEKRRRPSFTDHRRRWRLNLNEGKLDSTARCKNSVNWDAPSICGNFAPWPDMRARFFHAIPNWPRIAVGPWNSRAAKWVVDVKRWSKATISLPRPDHYSRIITKIREARDMPHQLGPFWPVFTALWMSWCE